MSAEPTSALIFTPGERVSIECRLEPGSDDPHPLSPMVGVVVDADGHQVRLQYGRIVTPVPLCQVVSVHRPDPRAP